MIIVNRRDLIRSVVARWETQCKPYSDSHQFGRGGPTKSQIASGLKALDLETCSSADVDAVMAANGWASNTCDECLNDMEQLVRLGEEPDYDARWWHLCFDCALKAVALLREAGAPL